MYKLEQHTNSMQLVALMGIKPKTIVLKGKRANQFRNKDNLHSSSLLSFKNSPTFRDLRKVFV